jgi:predicted membrane-bound spermidine synthase
VQLVEWIGAWPGAVLLHRSGTAYLFVNAAHILGIGLLVGAVLPLDLRILGFFRSTPLAVLWPFLSRAAGVGLGLAIVTGLWLFTVKPTEYLANEAFLWKAGLLVAALANILVQHRLSRPSRVVALSSMVLWLSVLIAGRWIGFV